MQLDARTAARDTATTVASTGTYEVARFGIEGRSVRAAALLSSPGRVTGWRIALDLDPPRRTTLSGSHAEHIRECRARTERRLSRSRSLLRTCVASRRLASRLRRTSSEATGGSLLPPTRKAQARWANRSTSSTTLDANAARAASASSPTCGGARRGSSSTARSPASPPSGIAAHGRPTGSPETARVSSCR